MESSIPRSAERQMPLGRLPLVWLTALALAAPATVFTTIYPASALSEIKREELPAPPGDAALTDQYAASNEQVDRGLRTLDPGLTAGSD